VGSVEEAERLCAERGVRLCTELEWERAAKGPASTVHYGFRPAAIGKIFANLSCDSDAHPFALSRRVKCATAWSMLVTSVLLLVAFALGFTVAHRATLWPKIVWLAREVRAWILAKLRRRMRAADPEPALAERLLAPAPEPSPEPPPPPPVEPDPASIPSPALARAPRPGSVSTVRFDLLVPRGTATTDLELHSDEWRSKMAAVGERFAAAKVNAIVFVHGTFAGSDPLSAYGIVERALPNIGPQLARTLRKATRGYIGRMLGDLGNFGTAYVRLLEEALRPRGARIPCTDFVWSSENHHVGRLEGALSLVRTLATHAELGGAARSGWSTAGKPRLLVIGHSHAAQLFALVTQLFARTIASEAILDIARARELDVTALENDIATLEDQAIDFVTFGAPARYAWASVANVRALHIIAVPPDRTRAPLSGDVIRRLGAEGSDFPPLRSEERRLNAALAESLGTAGFAPARLAAALRAGESLPAFGDVVLVEYPERGLVSTGLGHGVYTRLDGMLFHALLVADRLYPETDVGLDAPHPPPATAWSRIRARLDV
jgi:hypothetical protein